MTIRGSLAVHCCAGMIFLAGCSSANSSGKSQAGLVQPGPGLEQTLQEFRLTDPAGAAILDRSYAYAVINGNQVMYSTRFGAGVGALTPTGAAFQRFAAAARASGGAATSDFRGVVVVDDQNAYERLARGDWNSGTQPAASQANRPGTESAIPGGIVCYRIERSGAVVQESLGTIEPVANAGPTWTAGPAQWEYAYPDRLKQPPYPQLIMPPNMR